MTYMVLLFIPDGVLNSTSPINTEPLGLTCPVKEVPLMDMGSWSMPDTVNFWPTLEHKTGLSTLQIMHTDNMSKSMP